MVSFLEKMNKAKPVYDIIFKVCLFLCKIFLIADILLTTFSVLGRYVSFIPVMSWSEQVILTLMSYLAVLSAALAIRKGGHIRAEVIDRFLPERVLNWLDVLADLSVMILGFIMLITGMKYAIAIGKLGSYETIPQLSRFWMYFPIPVAGFFMIVFELETLTTHLGAIFGKEAQK